MKFFSFLLAIYSSEDEQQQQQTEWFLSLSLLLYY
tara:strand:+ start:231 stop:335 length:105 start_codon:yes stop_codon:yes gene_type:complete